MTQVLIARDFTQDRVTAETNARLTWRPEPASRLQRMLKPQQGSMRVRDRFGAALVCVGFAVLAYFVAGVTP